MDWYADLSRAEEVRELREELRRYLARHAEPDSDIGGALLVFTELLTNTFLHTGGPAWISVDWASETPRLTIRDLGPGFSFPELRDHDPLTEGGHGLRIASHIADKLRVAHRHAEGSVVSTELPVRRSTVTPQEPTAPTGSRPGSLPAPEEASADGLIGRESFLRALVVQLAQNLELEHGPAVAETAITRVGTDVGGRIEDEYRKARGIVDELTPEQMADLFVRLKGAIDGDFYVIEANEERIVLGNRRCPFGDVVRRAPALCQMTSSVFGGIASRNRGRSAVQLEERIAVGDPGCRVVVWLRGAPEHTIRFAHHYRER